MEQYNDSAIKRQTLQDLLEIDTTKKNFNSFDMYSKQFTHDQGYEDLMHLIHFERTRNNTLKMNIQQLKKQLIEKWLAPHFQQLKNLSLQNEQLRDIYRQEVKMKNGKKLAKDQLQKQDFKQKRTHRKSIPNVIFATQFSSVNNKKSDMRMSYKPIYESTSNLAGGTSLMPSPRRHKRRQSQLTQRKQYQNQEYSNQNSYMFQEKISETLSVKNRINNHKTQSSSNNIFLEYLQAMLAQQKLTQIQIMQDINEQILDGIQITQGKCHIQYVNQLQQNIKTTNKNLQNLQLVVNAYENSIKQIGIDLSKMNEMTSNLLQVKAKYIQMQEKVDLMKQLKQQVDYKQQKLMKLKKEKSQKSEPFQIPQSLKTLFKILNLPSNSRPSQYVSNLKKMSKNIQILFPHHNSRTKCKVKQLIDGIREGRKKFNQVLSIYEGRIEKLQQKISKVRQQKERKSIQQKK